VGVTRAAARQALCHPGRGSSPSSTSSRAGTTRGAVTRPSATIHPFPSRCGMSRPAFQA